MVNCRPLFRVLAQRYFAELGLGKTVRCVCFGARCFVRRFIPYAVRLDSLCGLDRFQRSHLGLKLQILMNNTSFDHAMMCLIVANLTLLATEHSGQSRCVIRPAFVFHMQSNRALCCCCSMLRKIQTMGTRIILAVFVVEMFLKILGLGFYGAWVWFSTVASFFDGKR